MNPLDVDRYGIMGMIETCNLCAIFRISSFSKQLVMTFLRQFRLFMAILHFMFCTTSIDVPRAHLSKKKKKSDKCPEYFHIQRNDDKL